MSISHKDLLEFYSKMLMIRYFEEEAIKLWDKGKIKGTIHPYIGQEAIAVGVCQALDKKDYIVSSHRGHGHYLAKGGDAKKMMAELLGKATGCCRGRGGSMHVADLQTKNIGANGLVGAGLGIAVGAALTSRLKRLGHISVAFFGEGATGQGMFHESLNMASVFKLPVLFICENNRYSVSTDCNFSMPVKNASQRAKAYNIPGVTIDGNDVLKVFNTAQKYIEKVRKNGGPAMIECRTYRWEGHYHGEPQVYRSEKEIEEWKSRCPIKKFESYLSEEKVPEKKLADIRDSIRGEMKKAVLFAERSPANSADNIFDYLYAD